QPVLSAPLREALQAYGWPGNIRELENVMKRFVILQDEPALVAELRGSSARYAQDTPTATAANSEKTLEPVAASANGNGHKAAAAPPTPQSLADAARQAVLQAERDLIIPT